MNIKMALAGCILFVSSFANAGIIYDFVCDDPTCGGNNNWGGSFEIEESAVLGLSPFSSASVISFDFTSPDLFGITWDLTDLVSGLKMTFSADGKSIDRITRLVSSRCLQQGDRACFRSRTGETLLVSANTIIDTNFTLENGRWLAREVSGPSTIAIFALGIMGLALRRFKKQS
ncbi:MAG: PEP-CTERM sorting domain-containing protein [Paraglaciecola sp.]|uniref:PEP-CTERM sorting domain-containing protein n=1 Tax=Paraglaciecola sp. TaxID=1920173 RepID=UPI0032997549